MTQRKARAALRGAGVSEGTGFFQWKDAPALHIRLPAFSLEGLSEKDKAEVKKLVNKGRTRVPGHLKLIKDLAVDDEGKDVRIAFHDCKAVALDREIMQELMKCKAKLLKEPHIHLV